MFWLDESRAHDRNLIAKVETYLQDHDTEGLDLRILDAGRRRHASRVERIRRGEDTISVTGNVLRDYNTDLFPILELGTSAKMLSVVPLMNGGGPVRDRRRRLGAQARAAARRRRTTCAGTAWASSSRWPRASAHEATNGNARAGLLGEALDRATEHAAQREQVARRAGSARSTTAAATSGWPATGPRSSPSRPRTPSWPPRSRPVAEQLAANETAIDAELIAVQGSPVDIGGYYRPDAAKTTAVMRPSATFNGILAALV